MQVYPPMMTINLDESGVPFQASIPLANDLAGAARRFTPRPGQVQMEVVGYDIWKLHGDWSTKWRCCLEGVGTILLKRRILPIYTSHGSRHELAGQVFVSLNS